MIAVIDTNCLLASIPPQSSHYWLYEAFKSEQFEWLISNEILTEYEEKLIDRYSIRTANLVLSILSVAPNVIHLEPFFKMVYTAELTIVGGGLLSSVKHPISTLWGYFFEYGGKLFTYSNPGATAADANF